MARSGRRMVSVARMPWRPEARSLHQDFHAAMRRRWRQLLQQAPLNILRPVDEGVLTDFVVAETIAEAAYAEYAGRLTIVTSAG